MSQTTDVIVITPHPDDAEFDVAGMVACWTSDTKWVVYFDCTSGEKGTSERSIKPVQLFNNKKYYVGPRFDQDISTPCKWHIIYWCLDNPAYDYWAVLEFKERFSLIDIFRTFYIFTMLWFDWELYTPCGESFSCDYQRQVLCNP